MLELVSCLSLCCVWINTVLDQYSVELVLCLSQCFVELVVFELVLYLS